MSDTPRTDVVDKKYITGKEDGNIPVIEFARKLERELSAAQAECANLREEQRRDLADVDRFRKMARGFDDKLSDITTAVGKLLEAIDVAKKYKPIHVYYQGVQQDMDVIRAKDYYDIRDSIVKAANAVREVMK